MRSITPFLALQEGILTLIGFPLWWYGSATSRLARVLRENFGGSRRIFQLRVLMQHIFQPMFGGDGTREMHIVSVMVRIPYTLGVAVYILLSFAALFSIFLIWLSLPVIVGWGIAGQFGLFLPR